MLLSLVMQQSRKQ